MKYVAFLDILGFKDTLKRTSQKDAKEYIRKFSHTIFNAFHGYEGVEGFIVSDSLILFTKDSTSKSLSILIDMIDRICKSEFAHNGILLRGAIAKGEFDYIPGGELNRLRKELIVGNAYVEAYTLESSCKTIGIILSESVYKDIKDSRIVITTEKVEIKGVLHYVLMYLTIDFLLNEENLFQFVQKAKDANWLPHYYNTISFAMRRCRGKKVEQVFSALFYIVCDAKPTENWKGLDAFIEGAFSADVEVMYKKRLLKYLRQRVFVESYSGREKVNAIRNADFN